jgi:hypothetical protein
MPKRHGGRDRRSEEKNQDSEEIERGREVRTKRGRGAKTTKQQSEPEALLTSINNRTGQRNRNMNE